MDQQNRGKKPEWMTGKWLDTQKEKLLVARERLWSEIDHETEELGTMGTPDPHEPGDVAQEDREDIEAAGTIDVSQSRFNEVESALKRIDEGTYGRCTECGKWIDRERIEAMPSAIRCLPCQEAFEKRYRPTPAGI